MHSNFMLRTDFERYAYGIGEELLLQASLVEQVMFDSVKSLHNGDLERLSIIRMGAGKIGLKHAEIFQNTLAMIASQRPISRDLRWLASTLEVSSELERMGDYALGVTVVCQRLNGSKYSNHTGLLVKMAETGITMLHNAMTAFIEVDLSAAEIIPQQDDEIDALYKKIYQALMADILANPQYLNDVSHLLRAAHNLERFADRVTNICERVVFVVTGNYPDSDPPSISADAHAPGLFPVSAKGS